MRSWLRTGKTWVWTGVGLVQKWVDRSDDDLKTGPKLWKQAKWFLLRSKIGFQFSADAGFETSLSNERDQLLLCFLRLRSLCFLGYRIFTILTAFELFPQIPSKT